MNENSLDLLGSDLMGVSKPMKQPDQFDLLAPPQPA
jgi:hypothetical protein